MKAGSDSMNAGQTGNRAFMVNQEGDLLQNRNQGAVGNPLGAYDGAIVTPTFDAAYESGSPGDMGAQLSISGAPAAANDANLWVPVQ